MKVKIKEYKEVTHQEKEIDVEPGKCYLLKEVAYKLTDDYLYEVCNPEQMSTCRLVEITKWNNNYNQSKIVELVEEGKVITNEQFESYIIKNIDTARQFLRDMRVSDAIVSQQHVPEYGC